ncbi:MAG TPA: DUF3943 domain-containing protein [Burkholderiales bacterium]|nr:DUF3943 domain-containing protein [Burkholderiales bacterium]
MIATATAGLLMGLSWSAALAQDPASFSGRKGPGSFSVAARTSSPDLAPASAGSFSLSLAAAPADQAGRASNVFVSQPRKRTLRAWVEWTGFLGSSATSYWIRYKHGGFTEDWQFAPTFSAQFKRFFLLNGWRFDSNNFKLNWTHSLAGGIYYIMVRTNYASWFDSWAMACLASTIWEGGVEWKEVISINDQIMTGLGGFATGEPWYQIGEYLSHQRSFLLRALGWFNPMVKVNRWLDRKDPATKDYIQPAWHDLGLTAGMRHLASSGKPAETAAYVGLHTMLLTLPDYGKPGEVDKAVKDVYASEISLDYAERHGHADETNLTLGAVTWGHLWQKIGDDLTGHSLIIGLGSSFQYFKKKPIDYYDSAQLPVTPQDLGSNLDLSLPRNFTDKLAIAHVAGPVLDWTIFRRGWRLRTIATASVDFGLINSLALNAYSELHHTLPDDTIKGMKETLVYYGYYYGFGGTFSGQSELEWGGFRARALASFGAWGSADFRHRYPGQITNDAHGGDNRLRALVQAGWKLPHLPLTVFARYEGIHRWGRLAGVTVTNMENRTFAGLEFSY